MTGVEPIRLGLVGAGANMRARHVPGFRALHGVKIVGVVNRTPESTARAAHELDIPRTYPHWRTLLEDPEIDAVVIGTWPNLHCEVTCAALDQGKHVLTEARMARDLGEARRMLATGQKYPDLVKQIVPSPLGLIHHDCLSDLIGRGFLGDLREVIVLGANDMFWDSSQELHWRQDAELSGFNTLCLGILHETVSRWTPQVTRVFSQTTIFEPNRPARHDDALLPVTVPDSVQVLTQLEGGARGVYHISGIDLFGPGMQIHLYGSRGTIKYFAEPEERVLIGHPREPEMRLLEPPLEKRGGWRVEAEFIGAIRGEETVRLTDFASGVRYMEFTEAVARSAALGQPLTLPLPITSN